MITIIFKLALVLSLVFCTTQQSSHGESHFTERLVLEGSDVEMRCYMAISWIYRNLSIAWFYSSTRRSGRVIASANRHIQTYGARPQVVIKYDSNRYRFVNEVPGMIEASLYVRRVTKRDEGNYMCNVHEDKNGLLYNVKLRVIRYTCSLKPPNNVEMSGCSAGRNIYRPRQALSCSVSGTSKQYKFKWYARFEGDVAYTRVSNKMGEYNRIMIRTFYSYKWWGRVKEVKCILDPPKHCPNWKTDLEAGCKIHFKIPHACIRKPPTSVTGADVVICIDMSSSIGPTNFEKEKSLVKDVLKIILLQDSSYVASVCSFSDTVIMEKLQPRKSLTELLAILDGFIFQRFGSDTAQALLEMGDELLQRGRDGRQKIAILITDSYSDDDKTARETGRRLRNVGIHVVFVPFSERINEKALKGFEEDDHVIIPHKSDLMTSTVLDIVDKIRQIGSKVGRSHLPECHKKASALNDYSYLLISDDSNKVYKCPRYTTFDKDTCECSAYKKKDWYKDSNGACKGPIAYYPFDDDIATSNATINIMDTSPTVVRFTGDMETVDHPGIRGTIGDGALYSIGMSWMEFPFYKPHREFKELFLRFRFYQVTCQDPTTDSYTQILAFDGEWCHMVPVGLIARREGTQHVVEINFSGNMGKHREVIPTIANTWIDVEVAITVTWMKIKVGTAKTVKVTFPKSRHSDIFKIGSHLTMGGGCRPLEYHAPLYIDEVYVFNCIPYDII